MPGSSLQTHLVGVCCCRCAAVGAPCSFNVPPRPHEGRAVPGAGQGLPPPRAVVPWDSPAPAPLGGEASASRSGPRLGRLARGGTWGLTGTRRDGPGPPPGIGTPEMGEHVTRNGGPQPPTASLGTRLGLCMAACYRDIFSDQHRYGLFSPPQAHCKPSALQHFCTGCFHRWTTSELEVLFPLSLLVASPRAWGVSPFNCKLQKRMKELVKKHVIQP